MFSALADFVSRRWLAVILLWVAAIVGVRCFTPRWDDVTRDGDFAFLPHERPTWLGNKLMGAIEGAVRLVRSDSLLEFSREPMPSVAGERLLDQAFPEHRAKSQIVLIVARPDRALDGADLKVADELARRFHNYRGAAGLKQARQWNARADDLLRRGQTEEARDARRRAQSAQEGAEESLGEALLLDERFAAALHNRALLFDDLGRGEEAARDREQAWLLDPQLAPRAGQVAPPGADEIPLVDVWTRHTDVVSKKLRSADGRAQLIILQLADEFMATGNIRLMQRVRQELAEVQADVNRSEAAGLTLGISGSAAVGGDMLQAAADSIKNTELSTILLVVVILLLVYRAPLLAAVPLVTIGASLIVATGVVAALTRVGTLPGFEWWHFKVFTTTKIFVVVILFGAGTDFCLFLIARYREELHAGRSKDVAVTRALAGVGDALAASALTTIFGLAMMFFADFGKFSNSGPAIGICLLVTLLACITLAPALLRALGSVVFWPLGIRPPPESPARRRPLPTAEASWISRWWARSAELIVARPGLILCVCVVLMLPWALAGTSVEVTYDFQSELSEHCTSRQGMELLRRHFPVGESGPVTVLATKVDGGFNTPAGEQAIGRLTEALYLGGVLAVRSIADPLGDRLNPAAPKRRFSLRSKDLYELTLRKHRLTREIFLTPVPRHEGDVARLELVLDCDPFSLQAIQVLARLEDRLAQERDAPGSFWLDTQFAFAGTTAAIRDLRTVTRMDSLRIQVLVVLAVWLVLVLILRQPVVSAYLMISVLFSYLVTIGATEAFFAWLYGPGFQGLDWKVPLFLFVILVAVGEDYNIYLVTRILEEQQHHGPFGGLRRAVVLTGGIITSCGVIMAGTFVSMTTGTLRGIAELGFALSLGVLLDTLVVRTVLVPAFLAIYFRWRAARAGVRVVAEAPPEGASPQALETPL